jgi:hypothetical protein
MLASAGVEVGRWLKSVVQGTSTNPAVPGNMDSLNSLRSPVIWALVPRAVAAESASSDELGTVAGRWSIDGFRVPRSCTRIRHASAPDYLM